MKIYDFDEHLIEGQEAEAFLDTVFSKFVEIQEVEIDLQRKGIDRIFLMNNMAVAVEYKADRKASITGNVFIEITSVSTTGAEGWARKTQADWIVYFLPQEMIAYLIPVKEMKKRLNDWWNSYPVGTAQNEGYHSQGILVPLTEIAIFSKIMCL